MGIFVQKSGFISNQGMWKDIVNNMLDNGFNLVSANGQAGSTLPTQPLTAAVLQSTPTVDPVAAQQPWRFCVKLTENSTEVIAAAPEQISDLGEISSEGQNTNPPYARYVGVLGKRFASNSQTAEQNKAFFWHRGLANTNLPGTMIYADRTNDGLIGSDPAAVPMTYTLNVSDHGVGVHIQIEGQDNKGCRQAWFVIQRAIKEDGEVVRTGRAPLFAIWTVNGGGAYDNLTLDTQGIQRRTVREVDVNVPTAAVSAVQHGPDSTSVINPMQQVAFSEDNKFDFRLPQGFNTQRFSYPYEIDMLGYASADVISSGIDIEVQVYDEVEEDGTTPKMRTYRSLSANNPDNTGMRVFFLKQGGGI